jgi:UDP-2-acetamido-3-amino-2,3-dideoxy-glucuronate N-acetyltransferase
MHKCVAVVGIGRWGKNLARNFFQLGVLHSICEMNESLLDEAQKLYPDVHVTSNYHALLENPSIKGIVIAAPAILHYKLVKEALLMGKDVYVEKPFCMDTAEGEELHQLAKERNLILMVGHILHYHPCVVKLKSMVKSGAIGALQYIVSNRLNLGSIRLEENALWNFAPHDISVILALCDNRMPVEVKCSGSAYVSPGIVDMSLTVLHFEGDLKAHIFVSWLNPFKEQKMTVIGSEGMIVFDDTLPWKDKLTYYPNYLRWINDSIPVAAPVPGEKIEVAEAEPLKEECAHFIKCCDERLTPITDSQEGLRVLKVLQLAQESMNETRFMLT